MAVRVRAYDEKDAPGLAAVFHDAVRIGALRDYDENQTRAWSPDPRDPKWFDAWARDGRVVLVAVDEADLPLAYGDLEADGHIDHLYCRSAVIGTGVASTIYERLEAIARARKINRLFVEASEGARRLFLAKGFIQVERRDFEVRGVPIHNYLMEERIDP